MPYRTRPWHIDDSTILTKREITQVLAELHRKTRCSTNTRASLIIFRLACCCGLRVSEIGGLQSADVRVGIDKAHSVIRPTIAKGQAGASFRCGGTKARSRTSSLGWPTGVPRGRPTPIRLYAQDNQVAVERRLAVTCYASRFRTACRCRGEERRANLTIHHGRHSFISHALAGGRTLAEVMRAAGHTNISITSCDVHVAVDDGSCGIRFERHWAIRFRRPSTRCRQVAAGLVRLQQSRQVVSPATELDPKRTPASQCRFGWQVTQRIGAGTGN